MSALAVPRCAPPYFKQKGTACYGATAGIAPSDVVNVNGCSILRLDNFDRPFLLLIPIVNDLQGFLSRLCFHNTRSVRPPHPAAGHLHLDMPWCTAGAETSERGIYRRACRVRSSHLPSLPQLSRSYELPPPNASTRSLQMPAEQDFPALDYEDPTLPNASIGAPARGDPQRRHICANRKLTPPFIFDPRFPTSRADLSFCSSGH